MHQLYAALLEQFALFLTILYGTSFFNLKSVEWHIKTEKILNGSCKIKIKNSCIQTGSTENGFVLFL